MVFVVLMGIFFGVMGVVLHKCWHNPLTVFSFLWAAISFGASLRLYGMYDFSSTVYTIVLIGLTGFFVGYISSVSLKKRIRIRNTSVVYNYSVVDKRVLVCSVAVLIFYFILSSRVLGLIATGKTYAVIRASYLHSSTNSDLTIYGSGFMSTLDTFVFRPMLLALIPINVVRALKNGKADKVFFVFLGDLLLYCMVNFGRIILVHTIITFVFGAFLMQVKIDRNAIKKYVKKWRKLLIVVVPLIVAIVYALSIMRQSSKTNPISVGEQFYSYMTVCMPLLGNWMENVNSSDYMSWGIMYFKGILSFLMVFFRKLGINPIVYQQASQLLIDTERFINVFPAHGYNAFVSMFFTFYTDFREIGVFFGSASYGFLQHRFFRRANLNDLRSLSIYLLLLQSLIKCFVRWEFVQMSYCLAFIWIFIWTKPLSDERGVDK